MLIIDYYDLAGRTVVVIATIYLLSSKQYLSTLASMEWYIMNASGVRGLTSGLVTKISDEVYQLNDECEGKHVYTNLVCALLPSCNRYSYRLHKYSDAAKCSLSNILITLTTD